MCVLKRLRPEGSRQLGNNERLTILPAAHLIRGGTVLAREHFRGGIKPQRSAELGRRFFEIDLVGRKVLLKTAERLGEEIGALDLITNVGRLELFAREVGNVGQVDEHARAVPLQERAVEVGLFAAANGRDEIGVMVAAAGEFLQQFSILIEGLHLRIIAGGNGQIAPFAFDDVAHREPAIGVHTR